MFRFTIRDVLWAMVVALGCLLLAAGGIAGFVGASVFASTTPVPEPWGMIGNLLWPQRTASAALQTAKIWPPGTFGTQRDDGPQMSPAPERASVTSP